MARRARHSADVLLKIYAGCINGAESTANRGVDVALGDQVVGGDGGLTSEQGGAPAEDAA